MDIKINGKKYKAKEGETVLDVCRRSGIRIPTLCAHGELKREAVCRLCLVETNLTDKLVPSCSFPVSAKLEVTTESEKIKKAREINMDLLWSDHAGKCVNCKKNRACELQNLAEEYKIENFHFVPRKEEMTPREELDLLVDNRSRVVVDEKNPVISRTTELCVECRRCINICPSRQYGFNHRSGDVIVGTAYEKTLNCLFCGACVKHCPTGALTDQNNLEKIAEKLDNLKILSVALVDPAIFESIRNELPEINSSEKLVGLLRALGFERVFDLGFAMESYLHKAALEAEENQEIVFSGFCPSFLIFLKKFYPQFEKFVSRIKWPDILAADAIKNDYARREKINMKDITVVSFSSCTSKKTDKGANLDHVLTVRELGRLVRKKGLKLDTAKLSTFDHYLPFEESSKKMIKSGGTAKFVGIKTGKKTEITVANRMSEVKKILEKIAKREIKKGYFEFTVCPGGCIGGGGQAINIK